MPIYFLIPEAHAQWHHDPATLAGQLRDRWPHARIDFSPTKGTVRWSILEKDQPANQSLQLIGNLSKDWQTIFMMGITFEDCVTFAFWYRSTVPVEHRIFLRGAPGTIQVEVVPDMTFEQVIRGFEPTLSIPAWSILSILYDAGKVMTQEQLIQQLRAIWPTTSENQFITTANEVFNQLWKDNLVSAPGVRWLSKRPDEVGNLLCNPDFKLSEVCLTSAGERAVIAHRASH